MSSVRIAAVVLSAAIAVPVLAQAPAAAPEAGQTAGQHFKNVQVLKDIPADELIPAMRFMGGALGVECEFCHVGGNNPDDRAKDDKKEKQTAREMMKMMKQINDTSFEGRMEVTCASCHNGHTRPQAFAPIATLEEVKARLAEEESRPRGPQAGGAPAAPAQQAQAGQQQGPPLPSADELFTKYEDAIGGDAAIRKITSAHIVLSMTGPTGRTSKNDVYQAADGNKLRMEMSNGRFSRTIGYDGTQSWAKDRNVHPLTGLDAQQAQLDSTFYRNLILKGQYAQARTFHKGKIGDKDVYAVRAAIKGGRYQDVLYFDVNSGLLVRRVTLTRTALGAIPLQTDFDNYTDYNGVKIATDWTQSTPQSVTKVHMDEVKLNVPIDSAKFTMPANQEQPAK